jgi:phospholipase/carboxylesterase
MESLKRAARSKPPILLVHGNRDDVVPVELFLASKDALNAAEIPFQWHLSAGLGHGIDEEGLRQGGLFLAQAFGLP